jgi:hypothetical protein
VIISLKTIALPHARYVCRTDVVKKEGILRMICHVSDFSLLMSTPAEKSAVLAVAAYSSSDDCLEGLIFHQNNVSECHVTGIRASFKTV